MKTRTKMPYSECEAEVRVHDCGFPRYRKCKRAATIWEQGHYWCARHAPSTVAARRALSDARFEEASVRSRIEHEKLKAFPAVVDLARKAIANGAVVDEKARTARVSTYRGMMTRLLLPLQRLKWDQREKGE